MNNVRKITDDLYWVGANDRRLALFENIHPLYHGVSYNAYVLLDEKTVLFDTADWSVGRQFLENIAAVLDGRPLDCLVINHVEPDHAASIEEILLRWPEVNIITTPKAVILLHQFGFELGERVEEVHEGDTRCFGKHTVTFVNAPMVHWPEAMVTFDVTDGVLFSADAFGSFRALDGKLFADEFDFDRDWLDDARRYYTNIVGKYGAQVQSLLKRAAGMEIQMICPLHGPIWRENLEWFLEKYQRWSTYTPEDRGVAIFCGSIYGHTENAANVLAAKLCERGVTVRMFDTSVIPANHILSAAFRSSHLVFAATTYNNGVFVTMENLLHDIVNHNLQNRKIAVIENGTWAPTSGKLMREMLSALKKCEFIGENVTLRSSLAERQLAELDALADAIAADIKG